MTKTWGSVEWKEKRAAYLVGKVCEMCGGSTKLAIHHRHPVNVGLAKWKSIRRNLERGKAGEGLSVEEVVKITNEKYTDFKERAEASYMDFSPENVAVLCKRCHYAIERGKVLCVKCKKHYHGKRYPVCYECNKKEVKPVG
jgi:hypothetical protein